MDKYQTLREKDNPSNNVYPNIQSQNIPDGAVTTAKIASNAITNAKIANNAVTGAKIADASISSAKIGNVAITEAKIATGAVSESKIATSAVTESKLSANAVTRDKINPTAITELNGKITKFSDTSFTTLVDMILWIEYQIKHARRPVYDDTIYLSTIDCISTDNQEITIKCSMPLQGISATETLTSDADVVAFYLTNAGQDLVFYGA